ncbi:uncharacterized protein LOC142786383 [Rhipicephalus microplus]|uniref:uncharacterized protein LOC142786383 n=1 Tax=Rhipicephalus microplus TaxID=6941 RepID=UPI003F6C8EA7
MPSSRSGAATPSASRPRNIWEKVRAAVATPGPIIAEKGAPRRRWRQPGPATPSDDSPEIHIDDDLRSRIAAAFNLPHSKRFGRRQQNTSNELERREPVPEQRARSPRIPLIDADVGRALKETQQEKAKSLPHIPPVVKKPDNEPFAYIPFIVNKPDNEPFAYVPPVVSKPDNEPLSYIPPVVNKPDNRKPMVIKPAFTKTPEKVTPKAIKSPIEKKAQLIVPTENKGPARATYVASVEPKTATVARTKNAVNKSAKSKATTPTVQKAVAKAAAAPITPLNHIQPELSHQQESGYPSELDNWVQGEGTGQDFYEPPAAAVLDNAGAYDENAQYLWQQYPTTADAPYSMPVAPPAVGVAGTTSNGSDPYYSGLASNPPTGIVYAEEVENGIRYAQEMDPLWMLDTDQLPLPPSDDGSIERRMTVTLALTAALVAMMMLTLICVPLVSKFLQAGADSEVKTSRPSPHAP